MTSTGSVTNCHSPAVLHCWVKGIQEVTFFPLPSVSFQRSRTSVCAGQALWKQGAAVLGSCNQNETGKLLSLAILGLQVWLQQGSVWDPPLHSLCCNLALWGLTPEMSVPARLTCWNPGFLLSTDQSCSALLGTDLDTQTLCHDHLHVPRAILNAEGLSTALLWARKQKTHLKHTAVLLAVCSCVLVHIHHSGISHFNYKTNMQFFDQLACNMKYF